MMRNLLMSFAAIFSISVAAQNGNFRGTIYDATTGETLIGVGVYAQPVAGGSEMPAVTDLDGVYTLNLPAGLYRIRVSYFGYRNYLIDRLELLPGSTHVEDVYMESASTSLDEVTVRARAVRSSEGALLLTQKNAATVMDGVSSQQISRMGDSDAASAIRRVTGVSVVGGKYVTVRGLGDRYSKTLLNGTEIPSLDPDRNSVQMDMFPSNLIDNMVVYKTFTPDLPGDFSGGLIDLTTKDFPEKFTFGFSGSLGWNSQATFKNVRDHQSGSLDFIGMDDGSRALPEAARDYTLTQGVTDPELTRSVSHQFANTWGEEQTKPFLDQAYSLSAGNQKSLFGMPIGFIAGLTYSQNHQYYSGGAVGRYNVASQSTSEELNPIYLLQEDNYQSTATWGALANISLKVNSGNKVGFNVFINRNGQRESRFLSGQTSEITTISEDHIFQSRAYDWTERALANFALNGEHMLSNKLGIRLTWNSSYTRSSQDQPDLRFFASDYMVERDEAGKATDTTYYIRKANYNRPSRFYREMREDNIFNTLALEIPLDQKSGGSKLKFGGSHVIKDRVFREHQYDWHEGSSDVAFDEVNGRVEAFFSSERIESGQTYVMNNTQSRNSYSAYQSVSSAFAMANLRLGNRWGLIGGVRYERTIMNVLSDNENLQPGRLNNNDFLPSVALNYDLTDRMKIRSSYTQTLARPTFRELSPFPSFSFTGDYLLVGNPELTRTLIHNADMRWEWYPRLGEIISFSLFYKRFVDPIEKTQDYRAPIGSLQISYANVGTGDVAGFELEVKKNLGAISDRLSAFDFGGNFAWIYAQVRMNRDEYEGRLRVDPNADEFRPMYGQSPYTLNAYLNYNGSGGWSASVSANTFGNRLAIVSRGALPDVYEVGRTTLNAMVQYRFNDVLSINLKGTNLLNPQTRLIHEFNGAEYDYQSYRLGIGLSLGFKYQL